MFKLNDKVIEKVSGVEGKVVDLDHSISKPYGVLFDDADEDKGVFWCDDSMIKLKEDTYKLINYFDVLLVPEGDGEEHWQVNDLCEVEGVRTTLKEQADSDILDALIEAEFLMPNVTLDDIDIWNDYEIIEFYDRSNGQPLGRLELIREGN